MCPAAGLTFSHVLCVPCSGHPTSSILFFFLFFFFFLRILSTASVGGWDWDAHWRWPAGSSGPGADRVEGVRRQVEVIRVQDTHHHILLVEPGAGARSILSFVKSGGSRAWQGPNPVNPRKDGGKRQLYKFMFFQPHSGNFQIGFLVDLTDQGIIVLIDRTLFSSKVSIRRGVLASVNFGCIRCERFHCTLGPT